MGAGRASRRSIGEPMMTVAPNCFAGIFRPSNEYIRGDIVTPGRTRATLGCGCGRRKVRHCAHSSSAPGRHSKLVVRVVGINGHGAIEICRLVKAGSAQHESCVSSSTAALAVCDHALGRVKAETLEDLSGLVHSDKPAIGYKIAVWQVDGSGDVSRTGVTAEIDASVLGCRPHVEQLRLRILRPRTRLKPSAM